MGANQQCNLCIQNHTPLNLGWWQVSHGAGADVPVKNNVLIQINLRPTESHLNCFTGCKGDDGSCAGKGDIITQKGCIKYQCDKDGSLKLVEAGM